MDDRRRTSDAERGPMDNIFAAARRSSTSIVDRSAPYIRASELGDYAFCAHAWWLRRIEGVEPQDRGPLQVGEAWHAGHGRRVWLGGVVQAVAVLIVVVVVLTAIAGGLGR